MLRDLRRRCYANALKAFYREYGADKMLDVNPEVFGLTSEQAEKVFVQVLQEILEKDKSEGANGTDTV